MMNYWYYWHFKSAVSKENCNRILELGKEKLARQQLTGKSTAATTKGDNTKDKIPDGVAQADKTIQETQGKKTYVRDSTTCFLNEQWVYDIIQPLVGQANQNAGWHYEYDYFEPIQFTKYDPGQFYGWHHDGGSCKNSAYKYKENWKKSDGFEYTNNKMMADKVRKLSFTLNLVDDSEYEGGDLKFDYGPHTDGERFHTCHEIRPQGSAIIFPSYMYHQVTPITKGTRYSLVNWIIGYPFK
tara:strand:+ start:1072 stop:1794 length:723 start_codon:yes stop_codon:yes gene_type:complete